ncbi:MAG: exodeoxyribonuclease VII small subunit [Firmicutes bacterium]|nr:exodeoxyribonuclease VII small subunit [Bacillota bacterium]
MAKAAKKEKTYEQLLNELSEIVAKMEEGALPLEEMLEQYRQGVALIQQCRARLDLAEEALRDD